MSSSTIIDKQQLVAQVRMSLLSMTHWLGFHLSSIKVNLNLDTLEPPTLGAMLTKTSTILL